MKFLIVTPSLNHGQFIERCVRSVLEQELGGIELDYRVLDGGSTDDTQQILSRLAREFAELHVQVAPDDGQADALCKGFAGSDADVLAWVNADDFLLPGSIAAVADQFSDRAADVVYGRGWFVDAGDRIVGAYPTVDFDASLLATFCFFSQPSTFFSRRSYEDAGEIDPGLRFCMDYDIWLRLAANKATFKHLERFLSATRLHDSTKTATGSLAFVDEIHSMLSRRLGSVPLEWQLYRNFRQRTDGDGHRSGRRPAAFGLALIETAWKSGQWRRLLLWSFRVFYAHLQARVLSVTRRGYPI